MPAVYKEFSRPATSKPVPLLLVLHAFHPDFAAELGFDEGVHVAVHDSFLKRKIASLFDKDLAMVLGVAFERLAAFDVLRCR